MWWVAVPIGAVAVLVAVLWLVQRSLIYFPDRSRPPSATQVLPAGQDVTLVTGDGLRLTAWYQAPAQAGAPTVLIAPGNGGNRAGRSELALGIAERGPGVLLMDYRGYGGNPGSPSEAGLAQDVRAARKFLLDQPGTEAKDLVYFGESLGAAVVTDLAVEHPPAALVLRSPFTSLSDVGRSVYGIPPGRLLRDHYPLAETIGRTQAPVWVIHGSSDTIVPPEQSRQVAQSAREAGLEVHEVEVPGADHNDPALTHGHAVIDVVTMAVQ